MKLRRTVLLIVALTPVALIVWRCRSTNGRDDGAEAVSAASKTWYDAAGNEGTCEGLANKCGPAKDEQVFTDLCVAKGFQAKTCGCSIRCSGKVAVPATGGGMDLTGNTAGSPSVKVCSADAKAFIEATASSRTPGTGLDRCIESHLCNGNLGWCSALDRRTTAKLRTLVHEGCESDVLGAFCKDGNLDSFSCPEADVQMLSSVWGEFYNSSAAETSVKHCIRDFVCLGDRMACTANPLKRAELVKASVDKNGCDYWLRLYCSIGAKSW